MTPTGVMMNGVLPTIHHVTDWFALGIELLAVAVIVTGVVMVLISRGTVRYLFHLEEQDAVERYKEQLGRPLLLGLLLSVASDVIRNMTAERQWPISRYSDCWCWCALR